MKYCNFVLHLYELYDIICKLKEVVIMDRQLVLLNNSSQMINKETINKLKEILNNAPNWWSRTTSSNISDNITIRTANTVRKIINK